MSEIGALALELESPAPSAVVRSGESLNIVWSGTPDVRVGVYMKLIGGCTVGGKTEWGAAAGSGSGAITSPVLLANGADSCEVGVSISSRDEHAVRGPFSGGRIWITALSMRTLTLTR